MNNLEHSLSLPQLLLCVTCFRMSMKQLKSLFGEKVLVTCYGTANRSTYSQNIKVGNICCEAFVSMLVRPSLPMSASSKCLLDRQSREFTCEDEYEERNVAEIVGSAVYLLPNGQAAWNLVVLGNPTTPLHPSSTATPSIPSQVRVTLRRG
jgi:hypothetical protein